jgi:hypothetical protein
MQHFAAVAGSDRRISMNNPEPTDLSYARRIKPPSQNRAIIKVGLIGIVAVVLVLFGVKLVKQQIKSFHRRQAIAHVLQLQQVCLQYVMPPGLVVYDDSPDAATKYPRPPYAAGVDVNGSVELLPSIATFHPPAWDASFDAASAFTGSVWNPVRGSIAFMHEVPVGKEKLLVLVQARGVDAIDRSAGHGPALRVFQFWPLGGDDLRASRDKKRIPNLPMRFHLPPGESLKVFSGRADPADPSHIIVPFAAGKRSGEVHIWIKPGSGGVLKFRSTIGATFGFPHIATDGTVIDGSDLYLNPLPNNLPVKWWHFGLD